MRTHPKTSLSLIHADIQQRFLSIMVRIETHARIYFRHFTCRQQLDDVVQETVALAWKWFLRLAQKGKDAREFASTLARYAARAVRCGRRLRGHESPKDVLSYRAQSRHRFRVETLPQSTRTAMDSIYADPHGQQTLDEYEERLADNTHTPPPDAAAFRIDFPQFLRSLSGRDRRLVKHLSLGHSAKGAARQFGVTPGRVSQLRVAWCQQWRRQQGDLVEVNAPKSKVCETIQS